jgi:1,4-dihydroxy-2-naphthoate octaprenyltransferase
MINTLRREGNRLIPLIHLARIRFSVSGLLVFGFGVLLGLHTSSTFDLFRISLSGLSVFCAQLSVSYSNDYFDYHVDQFTEPTLIAGGSGVLRDYPDLRPIARSIALILTSISLLLAVIGSLIYAMPFLFGGLVLAGNILGWCYSMPPIRLVDRGFGELVVIWIVGFMLPTVGYLAVTLSLSRVLGLFLVPAVVYAAVFIVSVEIPDLEADTQGMKRTVITRWGRRWGFRVNALCLTGITSYLLWLATQPTLIPSMIINVLGGLSFLPLGVMIVGLFRLKEGRGSATHLATQSIISLIVYLMLVDTYLLYTLYNP